MMHVHVRAEPNDWSRTDLADPAACALIVIDVRHDCVHSTLRAAEDYRISHNISRLARLPQLAAKTRITR